MDNYTKLFQDPIFWNSLKVTGYYVVINIVVQTIVALGLALLMDRVTKSTFSKGIILLPYLIATVVCRPALVLDARCAAGHRQSVPGVHRAVRTILVR